MKQHSFKIFKSSGNDNDLFRIVDLTDTNIVAVVYCYREDDWLEKDFAVYTSKDIRNHPEIGVRITHYNIFIIADKDNVQDVESIDKNYLYSVLRQMATYFKQKEIDNNPNEYRQYALPERQKKENPNVQVKPKSVLEQQEKPVLPTPPSEDDKVETIVENTSSNAPKDISKKKLGFWKRIKKGRLFKGNQTFFIVAITFSILFLIALILSFVFYWHIWEKILTIIFGLPFFIIMGLAFADDMFARR